MADGSNIPHVFGTHAHRGILWPNIMLDSSIDAMEHFEVRPDDVWVVTYPKSGTHWLMEITGLILANGYPERIDRSVFQASICMFDVSQRLPATKEEEKVFPLDMTPFLKRVQNAPSPRLIWSHLPLRLLPPHLLHKAKVLYLVRNPKDILNSMFEFYSQMPIGNYMVFDDVFDQFISEDIIWGPWFDHVLGFWKVRDHKNLLLCVYEDMKKNLTMWVSKIANHVGRPLSGETLERVVANSSFAGMKRTYEETALNAPFTMASVGTANIRFVRKGTVGQWKNRFSVAQNEIFDEWYRQKTGETDLMLTFE